MIAKPAVAVQNNLCQEAVFDYKIVRSRRRTLCVEVRNKLVVVRSPLLLPEFAIKKFLQDKDEWIHQKLCELDKTNIKGEMFLGSRVLLSFSDKEVITDDQVTLRVIGSSDLEKTVALEKLYRTHTIKIVGKYLERYREFFKFGKVSYRKYHSKWGSCSPTNEINFNSRLSMCPKPVVEYVVVHELCHTKIKNHSRRFYEEISKYLPDYKVQLRWMRKNRGLI